MITAKLLVNLANLYMCRLGIDQALDLSKERNLPHLPSPYQYTNSNRAILSRRASGCTMADCYVSRTDLEKVHRGICFANYQGYFLNVNFTVSWSYMGYDTWPELDVVFKKFAQNLRKKVMSYGVPYYCYTVFENGQDYGCHSHSGVHVPAVKLKDFRDWLKKYTGRLLRRPAPTALNVQPWKRLDPTISQWNWFAYSMKGLDYRLLEEEIISQEPGVTAHDLFGVEKFRYCGYIPFQRVRRSRSMMGKAQREADYHPEVNLYNNVTGERYSNLEYLRGMRDREFAEVAKSLERLHSSW